MKIIACLLLLLVSGCNLKIVKDIEDLSDDVIEEIAEEINEDMPPDQTDS